ncbi:MAG: sigma-54-dependent transcriptional regulator [Myxococcales bacterium]
MALRSILIVDDEEPIRQVLTEVLGGHGYVVRAAADGEEALRELSARDYDAIVTDVRMPKMDGLSLVRAVQQVAPEATVIVMSAYGSHDLAIEAMKAGAYDYLGKPFRPDEVLLVLRKAEERERLRLENRRLRREIEASRAQPGIIAESAAMKEVLRVVAKVAPAKTTVLIMGESGTGKELVSRAVHELSPRKGGPFVAVNCGAIPDQLIESELFGHAKGAFTGAQSAKRGLFEEADSGTLLLDEIGELPLQLQPALLRALQEGEIRRVGDARSIKVDVRVLAATNRDLAQEVAQGKFREDLFYRLNVVAVKLPPLRERADELPILAERFVAQHAARLGIPRKDLSAEALQLLREWRWPGNVRELETALARALVLSEADEIEAAALPEEMRGARKPSGPPETPQEGDLSVKRAQRALEADLIRRALERTGGNRSRAAELLELSPRALLYKIREYGLGE